MQSEYSKTLSLAGVSTQTSSCLVSNAQGVSETDKQRTAQQVQLLWSLD